MSLIWKQFVFSLRIEARWGTVLEKTGKIAFIDNRIDSRTGSISVRVTFANDTCLLVDGSFVRVRIWALEPVQRLLVPQVAAEE